MAVRKWIKHRDFLHNSEPRWHNFSEICLFTQSYSSQIDWNPKVYSKALVFFVFWSRKPWLEQNPFKQRFQELSDLAQNQHIRNLERLDKFCISEWVQNWLFWSNLSFRDTKHPNTVDFTWWIEEFSSDLAPPLRSLLRGRRRTLNWFLPFLLPSEGGGGH